MENNNSNESTAREELYKRAFDFIHSHRPQISRDLAEKPASEKSHADHKDSGGKGKVVDPEHDQRLRENREKKDKAHSEQKFHELEGIDKEAANKYTYSPPPGGNIPNRVEIAPKEPKYKYVPPKDGNIPNRVELASTPGAPKPEAPKAPEPPATPKVAGSGMNAVNRIPGSRPSGSAIPLNPGSGSVTGDIVDKGAHLHQHENKALAEHAKKLGGPAPWTQEKTNAVEDKIRQHPDFGPMLPKKARLNSIEEQKLRTNMRIGYMAQNVFGDEEITLEKVAILRDQFVKALQKEDLELSLRNDLELGMSLTASLLLFTE